MFGTVSLTAWYIGAHCNPADSHSSFSMLIQVIIWFLLSRRGRAAIESLSAASRKLSATQSRLLLDILQRNASTEFGLRHGFDSVHSRDDFVAAVPLKSYDCYAEYVKKITESEDGNGGVGMEGVKMYSASANIGTIEKSISNGNQSDKPVCGVLTADKVEFLACSAGTSGKNKIVPVTLTSKVCFTNTKYTYLAPL